MALDGWLSKTPTSKLRMKICKACPKPFQPWRSTQTCCSAGCALALVGIKKAKQAARDLASGRIELMSLRDHLNKAQVEFNKFIRNRDGNWCISCNKPSTGQIHAGHYRSTKAAPQLRFNEDNVQSQCAHCNMYNSGNIGEYRIHLIKKIGIERVEALENDNALKRYTIDDAIAIGTMYKLKLKNAPKSV